MQVSRILIVILIATGLLVVCASASERSDWEKACRENTIAAYVHFLDKYSKSPFAVEARERIGKLKAEADARRAKEAFDKTIASNNLTDWEGFLQKYPASPYRAQLQLRIDERIAALRALKVRRVVFDQKLSDLLPRPLEPQIRAPLARSGFEIVPVESEYEVRLTLADFERVVPAGSLVSFTVPVQGKELVGSSAWAIGATLRIEDRKGQLLAAVPISGEVAGKVLLFGGPDPNSPEAIKQRQESFVENCLSDITLLLVHYFGGDRSPEAVAAIVGDLASDNYRQRRTAIGLLGEIGTPETVPPLIAEAQSRPGTAQGTREDAMKALARIRDTRVAPAIIEIAQKDTDYFVKEWAIEALGDLGDQRALLPLVEVLRDDRLKELAAKALTKITGQELGTDYARWSAWLQSRK